ncbi:hypothetical protein LCGC14_2921020, partial [marine sediment metagenome]
MAEPDTLELIDSQVKEPKVVNPAPRVPPPTKEELFIKFEESILERFGDGVSDTFVAGATRAFAQSFNARETLAEITNSMADRKNFLDNQRQFLEGGRKLSKRKSISITTALLEIATLGHFDYELEGLDEQEEALQRKIDSYKIDIDPEYQQLALQYIELNNQINRVEFKLNYWESLPILWQSGDWTNFEQSLTAQLELGTQRPVPVDFVPPQISDTLTPDDIVELETWFNEISSSLIQIPGKHKLIELRDAYEKKARPRVVALDVLTTEEIIKNLTTLAVPEAIPGIGPEQVLALLAEFEGEDTELFKQLEDSRVYARDKAQQYTA